MTKPLSILLATALSLLGATATAAPVPFDDAHWEFSDEGVRLETYKGKDAVAFLNGGANSKDIQFRDGIIEFDILVQNLRSFSGIYFRSQDPQNREHFYLRPVQSGRPDANQYTPVYGGVSGWQLYHSPAFAAPTVYKFDEWMHVKMVIKGTRMDVYIDSDEPVLRVPELKRTPVSGGISISSGLAEARFANLNVTEMTDPPITGMEIIAPERATGLVTDWQVSDTINGAGLEGKMLLTDADLEGRSWQATEIEGPGYVNIGRYATRSAAEGDQPGTDTVLMRTVITADTAGPGQITFGYSDRARVYVNGALVYSGDNTYRSRDFRYLGTIGLFDSVHVPLKAGDNDVIIAVSEAFGGWGVMARVD